MPHSPFLHMLYQHINAPCCYGGRVVEKKDCIQVVRYFCKSVLRGNERNVRVQQREQHFLDLFRMLIYDEVVYRSVGFFEKYGSRPRSDRLENKVTNVFKVRRNLLRSQRFEHMETKKKKTRSKTRLVPNTHTHANRVRLYSYEHVPRV